MIIWTIFISIVTFLLAIAAAIMLLSVFIGVPFLPTHRRQAKLMMDLAEIKQDMLIIDLGSGAGRLMWMAADRGARVVGYELNPFLYIWTKLMILFKGLRKSANIRFRSLYDADISNADVVFAFLFPEPMKKLEHKLFSEMKPGAKIVSYTFSIPGRVPVVKQQGIYVYEVESQ